jgi:glycosyltransferase involved in cell wall biosynthesis
MASGFQSVMHEMTPDLVSTVIPVFNRPRLLGEAVQSVLAQTWRPIEVIVVDDGSTDETPQVCRDLAVRHPGIVRCVFRDNGGPGAARAAGTAAAQGEFVQYLDSDDLLLPCKFERQVRALRSRPDCDVAYCKTRQYWHEALPSDAATARTGVMFEKLFPELLLGRCWRTLTPLYRRSIVERAGPWSSLRQDEDWEFEARIAALGAKMVWCDEFLADVRNHDAPRAGGLSLSDPRRMRDRCTAHRLIYEHARRAGVMPADRPLQGFARTLFLLARQAGAMGLTRESERLFDLAREAAGPAGNRSRDFRMYACLAACAGWRLAGQLACWWDRWRPAAFRTTLTVNNEGN